MPPHMIPYVLVPPLSPRKPVPPRKIPYVLVPPLSPQKPVPPRMVPYVLVPPLSPQKPMPPRKVPYVLVPPLSPQKRKQTRSSSPSSSSGSSRAPSTNPSPRKRARRDKDVKGASSNLSNMFLSSSDCASVSSTASDFADPSWESDDGTSSDDDVSFDDGTSDGDTSSFEPSDDTDGFSHSVSSPPLRAPKSQHTENTDIFVTPVVGRILNQHLISPVSVVGAELEQANKAVANELHEVLVHHDDPESMRWAAPSDHPGFYTGVLLDGITYKIGDVVAVAPGDDSNKDRANSELDAAAHCTNTLANNAWFCRIMYFFEHPTERERGKPRKMFHAQWFIHGSRTFLQEISHSQALFLLDECDNLAVATILQKCQVRLLGIDSVEEPDEQDPSARDYFCGFAYDDVSHVFIDLPSLEQLNRLYAYLPPHKHCPNCGRKAEKELSLTAQVVGKGLSLYGQVYHACDFVYVKPAASDKTGMCLFIAQVTAVDLVRKRLEVRYYKRGRDERKVHRTPSRNEVELGDLDGVCYVRHFQPDDQDAIKEWIDANLDHFYSISEDSAYADDCNRLEDHCSELDEAKHFVRRFGQIPVLEVFSGAGGLSQGLGQSGFFKTEWAVEKSFSAAETFRLNHPETKVLCADINAFLRYAVDRRDGKNPPPLRSCDKERTEIPDDFVPQLGVPRLVCGGPPCQSFSGANSNKIEGDPRSALPFTMLSVTELYQPDYFLLENVTGLLSHAVTAETGRGKPIQKVMFKLICRLLMALGYQVSCKTLQAGQYGSPQDRMRFIVFAAKRGCKLPEHPTPMFAFPKPTRKTTLFIKNDFLPPVKRGRADDDDHIFAPHAGVTIKDAISDLPPFDWKNPHNIIKETPEDIEEGKRRRAEGIRQFETSMAPVGFQNPVQYATEPSTRYQKAMRRGNPTVVQDHVTDKASPTVTEATANIPLLPYANHKWLPKQFLHPNSKLMPNSQIICYGRLDFTGYFKTAMTTVAPRSRGSYVLHPTQKRAISVVEAKRCQGFPDDFILFSDKPTATARVKELYKHIGNAVPVPLGAALGRSLEKAFVETWKQIPKERSPEL